MSPESRIRVGVSLEGRRIPRWKRDILLALRGAEGVELALVVLTPAERSPDRGVAGALLRLYRAVDRRVFAVEPDPLERVDATPLLDGVPTVDRRKGRPGDAPAEPLDVAIALGGEHEPLLSGARLGVWTYRHGVGRERRDDLPYLRDIRERRLASHVALVRQSDHAVLARSTVRTDLVSLQRVRGAALLRCRHLADRCLRELRDGVDIVAGQEEPEVTRVASGGPSVTSLLAILGRIFLRLASHRVSHALWHEQWSLVVRPCEDRPPPLSFADGRQLKPPLGRDWADPFPLHAGDRSWLFFEEVPWRGGHGHISVGELDDRGRLHDVRVALATPHHL